MESMDGPRLARPEELPEILELLDRTFDYGEGGMAAHLPDAYADPTPAHHAVVRRDDTVVGHAGCFPRTLVVGKGELQTRVIGGVATDKRYRGNGYMSALMEFWLERLEREGIGLSNLGGDRRRYGRFGWELAGRERAYDVSERSFTGPGGASGIRRLSADTAADTEIVRRLHSAEPLRVSRDRERYATLLDQAGYRTLLYDGDDAGDGEAYLTFSDRSTPSRFAADGRAVVEYGGTAAGITTLLGHVLATHDSSSVTLYAPPSHRLTETFVDQSNAWRLLTHRMVNLHDLETVLSGFEERIERRWRDAPATGSGSVTLAIGNATAVEVSYDAESVAVAPTAAPADVTLDRRSMTRLLFDFGEHRPIDSGDPLLRSVLPLEFYLWRSEWL